MTTRRLVARVAQLTGLPEDEVARALDTILELIADTLSRGDEVALQGFGKFTVSHRAARQGRNPATGETINIANSKAAKFSSASALKIALAEGAPPPPGPPTDPATSARSRKPRASIAPPGGARSRATAPRSRAGRASGPSSAGVGSSGGARPAEEPPEPGERHINAWIPGRGADGMRHAPLKATGSYELHLNVGALRASGLIHGETRVQDDGIPPEGLETQWTLTSSTVELEAGEGQDEVVVQEGPDGVMTARFDLLIPNHGESELRALRITPRAGQAAEIEAIIFARGDIYRQFAVRLSVLGASDAKRSTAARLERDFVHAPAAHLGLTPRREWQRPPAHVQVVVMAQSANVSGSTGAGEFNQTTPWFGWETQVKAPIENVRRAAERFRAQWGDYLNDVPADDLHRRFSSEREHRGSESGLASTEHARAWRAARRSPELRDLASEGYVLYERFFKTGSELRKIIDALPIGSRLDLTWLNDQAGYIAQIPWTLMYSRAGGAVDPLAFLGLRFRLGYTTHPIAGASGALGDRSVVNCANFLYWGTGAKDLTGLEAAWQRDELGSFDRQLFWPEPGARDPKAELLRALGRPAPPPVPVLYLYCESNFGEVRDEPVLAFDAQGGIATRVRRTELGTTPLSEHPLVFANACTTGADDPDMAGDLQERFFTRGARAFLGTETKVPIALASRFARIFFYYFYRESDPAAIAAGEAVWQTRRFLWRHYLNLGGLFYTYVNQYELFFANDSEVRRLRA